MELQGKDVLIFIALDPTADPLVFKKLVCEEESTVSLSRTVNKRMTKCGSKIGLSEPEGTISGSGVAETEPETDEISHQDLLALITGTGAVVVKAEHVTTPALLHIQSDAYLTATDISLPADGAVSYNFTLELSGLIDVTATP